MSDRASNHITDGLKVHDPRGPDLPDAEAAHRYAGQLAQGLSVVLDKLNGGAETFVEVVDESGTTVTRLRVGQSQRGCSLAS
jgi:hypothetical protein